MLPYTMKMIGIDQGADFATAIGQYRLPWGFMRFAALMAPANMEILNAVEHRWLCTSPRNRFAQWARGCILTFSSDGSMREREVSYQRFFSIHPTACDSPDPDPRCGPSFRQSKKLYEFP